MKHIDIFIIPALNEEKSIGKTIASINKFVPDQYQYEIIVLDNGSSDKTQQVASSSGAIVYVEPSVTVGGLRNLGVAHSSGRYLIFLDADVRLTHSWKLGIGDTIQLLEQKPKVVTGSKCGVSESPSFIEKYWFAPLASKDSGYVNSGHLITSREFFEQIGGFSSDLISAEDFEFSTRAKEHGAELINNRNLAVVHEGYPSTLKAFMLREIWHGVGDIQTFKSFMSSKVAMMASFFAFNQLVLIGSIIVGNAVLAVCSFFLLVTIPLFLSYVKYKSQSLRYILVNALIFYLYLMSRFCSFFFRTKKDY